MAALSNRFTTMVSWFLLFMVGGAFAQDPVFGKDGAIEGAAASAKAAITAHTGILGVITIIAGLILLFMGHRLFYPTLFLGGFYLFGSIGYAILVNVEPAGGYGSNRDTILLVASLAFGIVGGIISVCLVKFGLACIGAAGGVALGLFILSFKDGGLFGGIGKTIFLIVMGIIGAIAILWLVKPVVIVGTSILGAYSIMFGVDVFTRQGFHDATRRFFSSSNKPNFDVYTRDKEVLMQLISVAILAVIGIVVQWRANRNRDFLRK
ncbi:hypothetical protein HDU85_007299 [Gaertneriomyces sp. JEL0708]|nr:hypothetical protein HDU85_007299 [Gaertneriomyces sp. JEL0708]